MAVDIAAISSPLATSLITITSSTASAENDIMGGSTTMYMIEVDNSLNDAEPCFVKLLDGSGSGAAGVVVPGTDAPHHIFYLPQDTKRTFLMPEGILLAKLNIWTTKEDGTSGTTSPTNAVKVEILAS